ncbi:MAG: HRDC domain-containing protein [Alkalispirochaetaceae bacterium]
MQPIRYIENDSDFRSWVQGLPSEQYAVAVDIEAEFNLHIYGEHFCLLQVYDGTNAVAVDPQEVSIGVIKEFLENRNLLKITYDSASDRMLLYKNHGILMNTILDLRPAVELLELQKQGLGSVLEELLEIAPAREKQRFQQYDWTKRPIDPDALAYAIDDVVHLYRLRDELIKRIQAAGLMDRYLVENFRIQAIEPETDRKPGMLRGGRYKRLKPRQRELLEKLHGAREAVAVETNLPPNSVFPNKALFALITEGLSPGEVRPPKHVPRKTFEALVQEFERLIRE